MELTEHIAGASETTNPSVFLASTLGPKLTAIL